MRFLAYHGGCIDMSSGSCALFPTMKTTRELQRRLSSSPCATALDSAFVPDACLDDIQTQADAMTWVARAAEQGNQNARLAVIPICKAFHCQLPADMPVEQWLRDMVEQHGSTVALGQLARLNPSLHEQVLHNYRRTNCGNSHVVFDSSFSVDPDQDFSKPLNDAGDTMLHT